MPPAGLEDLRTCRCRRGRRRTSRPRRSPSVGLRFGQPDGGDLRVAVGDPGDLLVGDHDGVQPRDLLGHEDALLEAAVRQLQAGHDVADRVHVRQVGVQPLVGDHEAAVQGDAGLFEAAARRWTGPGRRRPAAGRPVRVSPSSRVTVTPESSWVTPWKRTPVLKAILRLRNARSSCLPTHGSSAGPAWAAPRRWSPRCRRRPRWRRTRRRSRRRRARSPSAGSTPG